MAIETTNTSTKQTESANETVANAKAAIAKAQAEAGAEPKEMKSTKGKKFVDATAPWRVFEITLPTGEAISKRFRRADPVAVVIAKHPKGEESGDPTVKHGWLNHWTSNIKAAMSLAETVLKDHEGTAVIDGDSIRFTGEEAIKPPTPKKAKAADGDTAPAKKPSKKAPKKEAVAKAAAPEQSKDGGKTFPTKARAQVAAKAVGKRMKDVEKVDGGWIVSV